MAPRQALLALALCALALRASCAAFTYLPYRGITERLLSLAEKYPGIIKLDTAHDRFGLPKVGRCSPEATTDNCETWIVTLTDHASLAADPGRPQLIVSGEVHGDEVIGPQVVLAYLEMVAAKVAAGELYFKRMVKTRVVVALPMVNAVGFYRQERGERQTGGKVIDPNRDFAFDQDPKKCMQTLAARTINELFLDSLFRVLVTFHGGTNVLGYEWGDESHCTEHVCKPAPDAKFMGALGRRMSDYAGAAGGEAKYPVGTMGGLVYPVHGGMEDWAYGASWSDEAVKCKPDTLGGYDRSKTTYNKATNRCVTYLVETANSKKPDQSTLGSDEDMLHSGGAGDGHVPRNVRLTIAAVDAIEPYVVFSNATLNVGRGGHKDLVIHWFVAGSFVVDGTHLEWSDERDTDYGTSDIYNGTAGAPITGAQPTVFRAVVPRMPDPGTPLFIRAAAVVDSVMAKVPPGASSAGHVETHIVGSRVMDSWSYANAGKVVQGKRVWYTPTMRAVVDQTTGKLSVSADQSKKIWESATLLAPGRARDEAELLRGSGKGKVAYPEDVVAQPRPTQNFAPTPRHDVESALKHDTVPGQNTKPVMDPRDRDAVFSGILGVVMLTSMTGVIVVAMYKHYTRADFEKEAKFTVSEEEELNEPLAKGGGGRGGGRGDLDSNGSISIPV